MKEAVTRFISDDDREHKTFADCVQYEKGDPKRIMAELTVAQIVEAIGNPIGIRAAAIEAVGKQIRDARLAAGGSKRKAKES